MPTPRKRFEASLQTQASDYGVQLKESAVGRLGRYYDLLMKWNARLHLVAPCSPEQFATRHVLESLLLLPHLRPEARLIDVGSGAGLPAIPCLIARDDLRGILIESSRRKAVFLKEALRELDLAQRAEIIEARFEETVAPTADAVTCRALERFHAVTRSLIEWAPATSTFLLFGGEALCAEVERFLPWARAEKIPKSERRFLVIAARTAAP